MSILFLSCQQQHQHQQHHALLVTLAPLRPSSLTKTQFNLHSFYCCCWCCCWCDRFIERLRRRRRECPFLVCPSLSLFSLVHLSPRSTLTLPSRSLSLFFPSFNDRSTLQLVLIFGWRQHQQHVSIASLFGVASLFFETASAAASLAFHFPLFHSYLSSFLPSFSPNGRGNWRWWWCWWTFGSGSAWSSSVLLCPLSVCWCSLSLSFSVCRAVQFAGEAFWAENSLLWRKAA